MNNNELKQNPVVKKRQRTRIIFMICFIAITGWLIIEGHWGNIWSKFSRFWLTGP